ncbi:MAG: BMP family protein [Candidatus Methanosuratus sp.]|nr:BMP family protein [Candidatus Methanosuratincola sp.]
MKTSYIIGLVIVAIIVIAGAYYYTTTLAPQPQPFKVAAIYISPLEEPWNQALHQSLLKAEEELGIDYSYSENVPDSDVARVMTQYASSGFDMIFPHSWSYHPVTNTTAAQYRNIFFAQGSGMNMDYGNNTVLYDYHIQEAAYVAGAIAAKITNTSKIGIVTAFPGVGDVDNLLNGFIEGAKSVNPGVNITISYINEWYAPSKAKEAAAGLIESGVDVIYSERYGVFEACKDSAGNIVAYAFGNVVDQNNASDVVIGSAVWDPYPMVKELIQSAQNGTFEAGEYIASMSSNTSKFVWNPINAAKFPEAKAYSDTLVQQIINGTIVVPLNFGPPNP